MPAFYAGGNEEGVGHLVLEPTVEYGYLLGQFGLGRFRAWESGSQYLHIDVGSHS